MSFTSSLSVGALGETLYFLVNEGKLERLDGRAADFKIIDTGELIELKTDTYLMEKTKNFFIEQYSNKDKQSPGSIWQARNNLCKYFVYFYVNSSTMFTFVNDDLIKRIEEIAPQLKVSYVKNSSYTTQGYLVPREMVEDLAIKQEIQVKFK
jgi:GTPase SAR1 family protein